MQLGRVRRVRCSSGRASSAGSKRAGVVSRRRRQRGTSMAQCGPLSIAHTVQVQHLHLAQFGWRGPQLHLKCRGLAHTLSATSLSEVALRRTCTESIRRKSTLKTALTKKKLSAHLAPSA